MRSPGRVEQSQVDDKKAAHTHRDRFHAAALRLHVVGPPSTWDSRPRLSTVFAASRIARSQLLAADIGGRLLSTAQTK